MYNKYNEYCNKHQPLIITVISNNYQILERIVALDKCVNNMTWMEYLNRPLDENEYYVYQ